MINDFISEMKNSGLMKTNIFEVQFELPVLLKSKRPSTNLRKVLMFCDSATLPGVNISTNQNRTFGEVRENPYEKLYDNIQLTFYVDNSMEVKGVFDDWVGAIQDPLSRTFNYYSDYTTDIVIRVLDKASQARYEVKLFECYVKNIQPIQMDFASRDVMKVTVLINYRNWLKNEIAVAEQSTSSAFLSSFNFYDDLPIPENYFTDFSDFQGKFNNFNVQNLGTDPRNYLDAVTDSGVKQDVVQVGSGIRANLAEFGDNLNFDFIG